MHTNAVALAAIDPTFSYPICRPSGHLGATDELAIPLLQIGAGDDKEGYAAWAIVGHRGPLSVRPLSIRPLFVRPRPSVVVVRPLSVRPVVRLSITFKTSRSIRRGAYIYLYMYMYMYIYIYINIYIYI